MKSFSKLFVTLFYVGCFPYMPGTIGSLFSFILLLILYNFLSLNILILFFLFMLIMSHIFVDIYIKNENEKDPREIIIDEFLGCFLIIIFFKYMDYDNILIISLYSFVLFRIFDVLKIYPINIIDKKLKNPIGVILDDILASIYTIIVITILYEII